MDSAFLYATTVDVATGTRRIKHDPQATRPQIFPCGEYSVKKKDARSKKDNSDILELHILWEMHILDFGLRHEFLSVSFMPLMADEPALLGLGTILIQGFFPYGESVEGGLEFDEF